MAAVRKHFSQVSFRDQLTGQQGRKEIKPDFDFARKHNIAIVRLSSGFEIPAVVGLRTTVTEQTPSLKRVTDHWHVTISPFDEALLRRLHAKRNLRDAKGNLKIDGLDAPIAGIVEARYDAIQAIKKAHEPMCALFPTIGTVVDVSLAITKDLVRVPYVNASSTDLMRKHASRAINHNIREQEKFAAANWPMARPLKLFNRQVFPWWNVDPPRLMEVPIIPESDPWEPEGEYWETLSDIVAQEFVPVLESLWKAAFVQDGERGREGKVAAQLRAAGYQLDKLEATRVGIGPLRELMRANRKAGNLTMIGSPDLLDELGAEYIARLTKHGG